MALKTLPWDAAEYLETPEDQAFFLEGAFETGDPVYIAEALSVVARARGMTEIAREAGLSRKQLYEALINWPGPDLSTLASVARALGVRLAVAPAAE